jgi:hypothetical protein
MHAGLLSSALVDDPDRLAEGRAVDQPRSERRAAVERVAELAPQLPAIVQRVHALADERRAAAGRARLVAGGSLIHPEAEQRQLELGHLALAFLAQVVKAKSHNAQDSPPVMEILQHICRGEAQMTVKKSFTGRVFPAKGR